MRIYLYDYAHIYVYGQLGLNRAPIPPDVARLQVSQCQEGCGQEGGHRNQAGGQEDEKGGRSGGREAEEGCR